MPASITTTLLAVGAVLALVGFALPVFAVVAIVCAVLALVWEAYTELNKIG